MTNQSPPMGRMLRRALPDTDAEMRWIESGRMGFAMNKTGGRFLFPLVIRRSLNTTGRTFRQRQLDWDSLRFQSNREFMMEPAEMILHLAKPVTKKDILDGYLRAGHYFNNFKPRV